jgi:sulfhydrogenase subunit gamma (sulfur reductase)
MTDNIYMPYLMKIEKVTFEAPGVKTFMLKFVNEEDLNRFIFKAGQFGEYSVYGVGESTFCIASSPTRTGYIECTFRQTGKVTNALAGCEEGSIIGFRMAIPSLSMNGKGKICSLLPAE